MQKLHDLTEVRVGRCMLQLRLSANVRSGLCQTPDMPSVVEGTCATLQRRGKATGNRTLPSLPNHNATPVTIMHLPK